MRRQNPFEIATNWYDADQIYCHIQREHSIVHSDKKIPRDVTSREFAEWLTHQYRLAMAKGIQIGRGEE